MSIVKVGQVWQSCDQRDKGRQIEVLEVVEERPDVAITAPYAVVQSPDRRGRKSTIRLDRFRETSTGYRFIRWAS